MNGRRSVARAAASSRSKKPLARSEELVIEELGDELLVYDERTQRAHCLSATAARVWRACDGKGRLTGSASSSAWTLSPSLAH